MSNFKNVLKELRAEYNLTQTALANKLGVKQGVITNWELRGSEPTAEYLIKLANIFQVSTDYLLGIENEEGIIVMQNNLSDDENYLINMVRQLSPTDKKTLIDLTKVMLNNKK